MRARPYADTLIRPKPEPRQPLSKTLCCLTLLSSGVVSLRNYRPSPSPAHIESIFAARTTGPDSMCALRDIPRSWQGLSTGCAWPDAGPFSRGRARPPKRSGSFPREHRDRAATHRAKNLALAYGSDRLVRCGEVADLAGVSRPFVLAKSWTSWVRT